MARPDGEKLIQAGGRRPCARSNAAAGEREQAERERKVAERHGDDDPERRIRPELLVQHGAEPLLGNQPRLLGVETPCDR